MNIKAYQRLKRTPMFRRNGSSRPENITYPANGMNHRTSFVQLATQPVDQHVHHVGLWIKTEIKNVFQNHGFRDRPVWVAHEIFEQGELAGLQFDLFTGARDLARE